MRKKEKKYRQQILKLLQLHSELIFKGRKKDFTFSHNENDAHEFRLSVCKNDKKVNFIFQDYYYPMMKYSGIGVFWGLSFQIGRRTAPSTWKLVQRGGDGTVSEFIQNDELLELIEYFLIEYDGSDIKKKIFLIMKEKVETDLFRK